MSLDIGSIIHLLRCPNTKSKLSLVEGCLKSDEGAIYPIINGKPILVNNIKDMHLNPPSGSIVSQTTSSFYVPPTVDRNAICINLGSGNVPSDDPRVISLDILPNSNVDVVAECEHLPFADCSIDYIGSYSVFEHVMDPVKSIAEAKRILKEGGSFCIDTAFMQGYHGFPSHYFNMTPQAVEAILCDDFILENSFVPGHLSLAHALVTQFDRFLEQLPRQKADMLRNLPLWAVLDLLRSADNFNSPLLVGITEYAHRSLAASFTVVAQKPAGYDAAKSSNPIDRQERLEYYSARMGLIKRHHEIDLYTKFIKDRCGEPPSIEYRPLSVLLEQIKVFDPMRKGAFGEATRSAAELDVELTMQRDRVIRAYLS